MPDAAVARQDLLAKPAREERDDSACRRNAIADQNRTIDRLTFGEARRPNRVLSGKTLAKIVVVPQKHRDVDAHGYQRTWAGERFLRTTENGENPNLNFPYRWREAPWLLSRLLGRRLRRWMGPRPASAGCVKSLVSELNRLTNLQLFLDFHGFGRLWLYPWCHSKERSPHDTVHTAAAAIAVAAANRLAGRSAYRAQAAAFTEVPMGGSCIDFVYGEVGCAHSYAVELLRRYPEGACSLQHCWGR